MRKTAVADPILASSSTCPVLVPVLGAAVLACAGRLGVGPRDK